MTFQFRPERWIGGNIKMHTQKGSSLKRILKHLCFNARKHCTYTLLLKTIMYKKTDSRKGEMASSWIGTFCSHCCIAPLHYFADNTLHGWRLPRGEHKKQLQEKFAWKQTRLLFHLICKWELIFHNCQVEMVAGGTLPHIMGRNVLEWSAKK